MNFTKNKANKYTNLPLLDYFTTFAITYALEFMSIISVQLEYNVINYREGNNWNQRLGCHQHLPSLFLVLLWFLLQVSISLFYWTAASLHDLDMLTSNYETSIFNLTAREAKRLWNLLSYSQEKKSPESALINLFGVSDIPQASQNGWSLLDDWPRVGWVAGPRSMLSGRLRSFRIESLLFETHIRSIS